MLEIETLESNTETVFVHHFVLWFSVWLQQLLLLLSHFYGSNFFHFSLTANINRPVSTRGSWGKKLFHWENCLNIWHEIQWELTEDSYFWFHSNSLNLWGHLCPELPVQSLVCFCVCVLMCVIVLAASCLLSSHMQSLSVFIHRRVQQEPSVSRYYSCSWITGSGVTMRQLILASDSNCEKHWRGLITAAVIYSFMFCLCVLIFKVSVALEETSGLFYVWRYFIFNIERIT